MEHQLAILLPHYNNIEGLTATLHSLLTETEPFTLIIIDDGSNNQKQVDGVIASFKSKLDITLIKQTKCLGVTAALNNGLNYILNQPHFKYIARLDAGDKCINNRLAKQLLALQLDPKLGLVSSYVTFTAKDNSFLFNFKPPVTHSKLQEAIYKYNPFIHPAVMYKTEVVKIIGLYPENYPALEDHAYFFKVIKHFKTMVLPELLLEYEVNPNSISNLKRKQQTKSRIKLLKDNYNYTFTATLGLVRAFATSLIPKSILLYFKKTFFYK
ncbi:MULTISPECIES: glycosyltransferase [unclassified Olleya]|jgi:glycosyltransferase involved in cell wall biosynthesis|uniref:glycosyltransferase n=1 Tax=unclassified Olleya TaxID=2615019 RepID=UPI0011A8A2BC|nr:glycosyltransferase [Olleya sp. Hel_I_94]TVZ49742.1 glycosyltransferase involved in cell wall biosynthesis [Olleya sp. Hel_I_94]